MGQPSGGVVGTGAQSPAVGLEASPRASQVDCLLGVSVQLSAPQERKSREENRQGERPGADPQQGERGGTAPSRVPVYARDFISSFTPAPL